MAPVVGPAPVVAAAAVPMQLPIVVAAVASTVAALLPAALVGWVVLHAIGQLEE